MKENRMALRNFFVKNLLTKSTLVLIFLLFQNDCNKYK